MIPVMYICVFVTAIILTNVYGIIKGASAPIYV